MKKEKKYRLLVVDPPWKYDNVKTGGNFKSGSAQKYSVMSVDEICALPIQKVSDRNSVLFLWVTTPMIEVGFKVLKAWGYKYKTIIFWRKIMGLGLGFWFRGQVEMCLLGVKGKVIPFRIQKANFIQSKARKHSQKPEEFFELIQGIDLHPRLELFATKEREGWDTMGFEINGRSIQEELDDLI